MVEQAPGSRQPIQPKDSMRGILNHDLDPAPAGRSNGTPGTPSELPHLPLINYSSSSFFGTKIDGLIADTRRPKSREAGSSGYSSRGSSGHGNLNAMQRGGMNAISGGGNSSFLPSTHAVDGDRSAPVGTPRSAGRTRKWEVSPLAKETMLKQLSVSGLRPYSNGGGGDGGGVGGGKKGEAATGGVECDEEESYLNDSFS